VCKKSKPATVAHRRRREGGRRSAKHQNSRLVRAHITTKTRKTKTFATKACSWHPPDEYPNAGGNK
jgi:hypothetical protein